jgi:hypothetical protein
VTALIETALDYQQQGWGVMRLPPRSKEPYEKKTHAACAITNDNINSLAEDENLAVTFTTAGALKDLDLDYDVAADLAKAIGLDAAAFGRGSVIGHYLFNAPGCEAKKFELPMGDYPRDLPLHEGAPSRMVLEIRGNDNTYTMFPPSMHPCGERLHWVGTRRKPTDTTAAELMTLAGRHAVAAAVLYFYPDDATARYDVRMALAGALVRCGMPADLVATYVRQVAKLGGDPKWEEDFAERTAKQLQKDGKKVTGLTKLVEVLQLPDACVGTFNEWLNGGSGDDAIVIIAEPYTFPAEETIPRYDFLLGKHLLRDEVAGTAAMGGTGKSNLSIVEAISMTTGLTLLHDAAPKEPLRVVLINLEDSRSTMDRRIAAVMRHYGLKPAGVGDRLTVIAKGEIDITVAKQLRSGDVERNEQVINALTNLMIEKKADVLSIDSFIRTHHVHENDNSAIQKVVSCFETIASSANCAVHLWHHSRKMGGDRASVESARGAQAFIDACRSVRILETMTRKERDDLVAIVPDIGEPGFYFREFNGKINFAPPTDQSNWFKLLGVKIHNWTSEAANDGDNIGVATPWRYPRVEMPTITDADIERALAEVRAGGPWRADTRSSREVWVGVPIANALGLNLLDVRVKRAVVKLVKNWLAAGRLRRVERTDQNREKREYIEVAAVE